TGNLQRCLIRLGTAITEKGLATKGVFREKRRHFRLGHSVVKIRHVDERLRLLGNGLDYAWMAVPEHSNCQAAEKISVRFALGVPYGCSLTADEGDRVSSIGLDNDLVSLGNNLLVGHVSTPIYSDHAPCDDHVALRR